MRYNSMPKGEFFFVVNETLASSIFNLQDSVNNPIRRVMTIGAPELISLYPSTITLYVFMASEIKGSINYIKLHKSLRKSIKKYYK